MKKHNIYVIDDETVNLSVLSKLLSDEYNVYVFKSGEAFLTTLEDNVVPDIVLLDIMMNGLDGYQTLERFYEKSTRKEIPVIFITSLNTIIDEERGFSLGAVDYITKPFNPHIVKERIRVQLELKEARDILKNQNVWLEKEVNKRIREIILIQDLTTIVIAQLIETRDLETGNHIIRTSRYVEILATGIQHRAKPYLTNEQVRYMVQAAPLHDLGKIGISDKILLKEGKLTDQEFEIMKNHSKIGGEVIERSINYAIQQHSYQDVDVRTSLQFLDIAKNLIKYHHERWDGLGYPEQLTKTNIPIEARIMSVADVFDALINRRIYKEPWDLEDTLNYLKENAGKQFDPVIIEVFFEHLDEIVEIANILQDEE